MKQITWILENKIKCFPLKIPVSIQHELVYNLHCISLLDTITVLRNQSIGGFYFTLFKFSKMQGLKAVLPYNKT